jgi:TraX protein
MKAVQTRPLPHLFSELPALRPVLNSGQQETLKWLAVLTMTFHTTDLILFANTVPLLFWLSRVAFPLFAFLIAYNLVIRKVKPTRYLYPLLIFALFTQPVYIWSLHRNVGNIMFTLCFGVLYVGLHDLLSKRLSGVLSHVLLVLLFFTPALQMDYGPAGVFLIPILVWFLKRPSLAFLFGLIIYLLAVNTFAPYALWGLLVIPILYAVTRYPIQLTRQNPWLFYSYYPAHLLLLKIIAVYLR